MKLNPDSSFNQVIEYLWLDDLPIAQIKTTYGTGNAVTARRLTYIHADHLNTPRLMTDANKTVVWKWYSDAYGMIAPNANPDGDSVTDTLDLRFPGQIADSESGLYYNMHRYYDPMIGRYITSDPIGLDGGLNTFGYVNGNPVRYIDPTGEIAIAISGARAVQGLVNAAAVVMGMASGTGSGSDAERQAEYERAKNFCDTPPPEGSNDCATLSNKIKHAKQCIDLYGAWDAKWLPGRHSLKIQEWRNRLNNLKQEHKQKCTDKCP